MFEIAAKLNFFGSILDAVGVISSQAQKTLLISAVKTVKTETTVGTVLDATALSLVLCVAAMNTTRCVETNPTTCCLFSLAR